MSKRARTVQNPGGTPVHVTGYGDVQPGSEPVEVPASETLDWLLEHGALVEPDGEETSPDAEPSKTSRRRSTGGTRASETPNAAETPDSTSKETP